MNNIFGCLCAKIRINGFSVSCLLFESRHDKELKTECQRLGYTVYDIRHSEDNWAGPYSIEQSVIFNFWGYIALKDEKAIGLLEERLSKDGFFSVDNDLLRSPDMDVCILSHIPSELSAV